MSDNTPLIDAIINGDIDAVKKRIAVNEVQKTSLKTPLMIACEANNHEIFKILLSTKEINIKKHDSENNNIAHYICMMTTNTYTFLDTFIRSIAPSLYARTNNTSLLFIAHNALSKSNFNSNSNLVTEYIDTTIEKEQDKLNKLFSKLNKNKILPIDHLFDVDDAKSLKLISRYITNVPSAWLIDKCCDKNAHRCLEQILNNIIHEGGAINDFKMQFMTCCKDGKYECVKVFLQYKGLNINFCPLEIFGKKPENTPLITAFCNGHMKIVDILLQYNANIEVACAYNPTLLSYACADGNIRFVKKLLLLHNANVETTTILKQTVFIYIAQNNTRNADKVVSILIKHIQNTKPQILTQLINHMDVNHKTALMYAYEYNNIKLAKILAKNGANVRYIRRNGDTLLIEASKNNDVEFIKLAIKYGVDPNIKDNEGYTALNYAMSFDEQSCRLLRNYTLPYRLLNFTSRCTAKCTLSLRNSSPPPSPSPSLSLSQSPS